MLFMESDDFSHHSDQMSLGSDVSRIAQLSGILKNDKCQYRVTRAAKENLQIASEDCCEFFFFLVKSFFFLFTFSPAAKISNMLISI